MSCVVSFQSIATKIFSHPNNSCWRIQILKLLPPSWFVTFNSTFSQHILFSNILSLIYFSLGVSGKVAHECKTTSKIVVLDILMFRFLIRGGKIKILDWMVVRILTHLICLYLLCECDFSLLLLFPNNNWTIFSQDFLAVSILWFCTPSCWWDMNIHVISSALTFRPFRPVTQKRCR